jgi:serine/threonine-protein kinase
LANPGGIAIDDSGDVYVANSAFNTVVELPNQAGTWGSQIALPFTGFVDDDSGGITTDDAGDVYTVDYQAGRAYEIPRTGETYGAPVVLPFSGPMFDVYAIAVDQTGDVFVSKYGGVVELPSTDSGWGPQLTLPISGIPSPVGLALDLSGDLFIADLGNSRIVELPKAGSAWGPEETLPFTDLRFPQDVAVDGAGTVYTTRQNDVVELPKSPSGYGAESTLPFDGLVDPEGIAVDADDDVYVAASLGPLGAPDWGVVELPTDGNGYGAQVSLPFTGLENPYPQGSIDSTAVDAQGDVFATGIFEQLDATVVRLPAEAPAVTTVLSSSVNPSVFGAAVTFKATVNGASGGSSPTGTAQFAVDGVKMGTPVGIGPDGVATSSAISSLSVGSHVVTTTYSGDDSHDSSSATLTQVVQIAPTALTASAAIVSLSALKLYAFTLSATLSGPDGPISGQVVNFSAGKTSVCSATTDEVGTATCPGLSSALGIVEALGYTAVYAGNTDYAASSAKGTLIGT